MSAISDNGKFPMVNEEDLIFKTLSPMAEEIMVMLREVLEKNYISPFDSLPTILITKNMSAVSGNGKFLMVDEEDLIFKKSSHMAKEIMTLRIPPHLPEYQLFYEAWPFEQYQQDMDYVRVVSGTDDGGTGSMKDKVSQEHVCEEEVPLNNNIGKQSGDLVEMPSEAVEQGMDDHVPDEIDGAKCEQLPNHVVKKGNLEFLVCKQVENDGGDELVEK
ncbi:hypothetical protein Tco_1237836 [Tanacetum coccineum]